MKKTLKNDAIPTKFCNCQRTEDNTKEKHARNLEHNYSWYNKNDKSIIVNDMCPLHGKPKEHQFANSNNELSHGPVMVNTANTDGFQSDLSDLRMEVCDNTLNDNNASSSMESSSIIGVKYCNRDDEGNLNDATLHTEYLCNCSTKKLKLAEKALKQNYILQKRVQNLKQKLRRQEISYNEKLKNQQQQFEEQLKKIQHDCSIMETSIGKYVGPDQIRAMITENSRGVKWNNDTIQKALKILFTCGSKGYDTVSESLVCLPSIRTLQRRIQHFKFQPGILHEIFDALKDKVSTMNPADRDCCLFFDEMSIKEATDFDTSTSSIIGNATLTGSSGSASKALVFVLGGIRSRWKQIVAYHFTPSTTNIRGTCDEIMQILQQCHAIELNVIGIICDMDNRNIMSALGFQTKKNNMIFSMEHPFSPNEKLYYLPDSVHVFKNVKQMLENNKEITLPDEVVKEYDLPSPTVQFSHIEYVVDYQKDMDLKFAPKLTVKNVYSNHFNKMKVDSARHVINDKTSAALDFLVISGQGPEELRTTAWFVSLMNSWFKYVTSRTFKLALSKKNARVHDETVALLRLVIKVFSGMKVKGGWKPSQTGVIMVTSALLEIKDYLLEKKSYEFVLTGRFTQDIVENIFGLIRLIRSKPSPLEFKHRLRQLCLSQFMKPVRGSSYDFDDREDVIDVLFEKKPSMNRATVEVKLPDDIEMVTIPAKEEPVLYRMFGYVIHKLSTRKILKCDTCHQKLLHSDENIHPMAVFTVMTDFTIGAQVQVSDEVFMLLLKAEQIFRSLKPHFVGVSGDLHTGVTERIKHETKHLVLSTCHTDECRQKMFDYFVRMRLKQQSRTETRLTSQLASKSMGACYLADKFRIK